MSAPSGRVVRRAGYCPACHLTVDTIPPRYILIHAAMTEWCEDARRSQSTSYQSESQSFWIHEAFSMRHVSHYVSRYAQTTPYTVTFILSYASRVSTLRSRPIELMNSEIFRSFPVTISRPQCVMIARGTSSFWHHVSCVRTGE